LGLAAATRLLVVAQEASFSPSRDIGAVAPVDMLAVEIANMRIGNVGMAVGVIHDGGGL